MKRVEVYEAIDGTIEKDLGRAFASELHATLPNSKVNPNSRVLDWGECLTIIEQADVIAPLLATYLDMRGPR